MALLTTTDIESFTPDLDNAQRQEIITSAEALASYYAPCITVEPIDPRVKAIAKAIILKAIKYDLKVDEAGPTTNTEQLGPYGVTHHAPRSSGTLFSPSQIEVLRGLCGAQTGAYSVPLDVPDTLPGW